MRAEVELPSKKVYLMLKVIYQGVKVRANMEKMASYLMKTDFLTRKAYPMQKEWHQDVKVKEGNMEMMVSCLMKMGFHTRKVYPMQKE